MITGKMIDRRHFVRYRCKGALPGVMYFDQTRAMKISCIPIDVSKVGLAITSDQDIQKGQLLFFESNSDSVEMKVVFSSTDANNPGQYRYGLLVTRSDFDLENFFRKAGCIEINNSYRTLNLSKNAAKSLKEEEMFAPAVRATRFKPDQTLTAEAKTFGSRIAYLLNVEDLSLSGLRLSIFQEKVPFLQNTILELVIDPKKLLLENAIVVSVKVVDRQENEGRTSLKTVLIDMEDVDLQRWEKLIWKIEQSALD